MTVAENGVVCCAAFTARVSPLGFVLKVSTAVFGLSRMLFVEVSPPESVAVRRSSSQLGYA